MQNILSNPDTLTDKHTDKHTFDFLYVDYDYGSL